MSVTVPLTTTVVGGGGDNGDGLNRILGMKPSAVDRHEYKKYRCLLLLSGVKIIYGMNNRFDFHLGFFCLIVLE